MPAAAEASRESSYSRWLSSLARRKDLCVVEVRASCLHTILAVSERVNRPEGASRLPGWRALRVKGVRLSVPAGDRVSSRWRGRDNDERRRGGACTSRGERALQAAGRIRAPVTRLRVGLAKFCLRSELERWKRRGAKSVGATAATNFHVIE